MSYDYQQNQESISMAFVSSASGDADLRVRDLGGCYLPLGWCDGPVSLSPYSALHRVGALRMFQSQAELTVICCSFKYLMCQAMEMKIRITWFMSPQNFQSGDG